MIRSIEEAKTMQEYCRHLGREGVGERIIEIAQKIVEAEGAYQSTIKYAGMIRMLATGCKWDTYWDEKQFIGKQDMLEEARWAKRKADKTWQDLKKLRDKEKEV